MRCIGVPVLALVVAGFTSEAQAGWQWTEWRMTPDQVRAAAPVPLADDLTTDYKVRNFEFSVKFDFIDSLGLFSVTLTPKNLDWCSSVREDLALTYDPPVTPDTWLDTYNGNFITFSQSTATSCTVVYSLGNKANTPGEL
jgi:hypothetical protein